jgi:hypothetical protein
VVSSTGIVEDGSEGCGVTEKVEIAEDTSEARERLVD